MVVVYSRGLHFFMLLVSGLSAVGLTGCGSYYKYDATVPSDQRKLIEKDMSRLDGTQMMASDPNDLQLFNVTDFSGKTLVKWLKKGTRIVVGEDYDWSANLVTKQPIYSTPAPLTGAELALTNVAASSGTTVTVMVNEGASAYLTGVDKNVIYTVKVAGENVEIWSPMAAGIIKVGEGLFNQMIQSSPLDSWAHSIRRQSTYVHERFHVQGNGYSRAFAHATCPSNFPVSAFQGQSACENYINGPYVHNVIYLKNAIAQLCTKEGCTSAEMDALMKAQSDYDSRKLWGAYYGDPTPEGYAVGETLPNDY